MVTYESNSQYFTATLQADPYGTAECNVFSLSRTMLRLVRVTNPQLSVFRCYIALTGTTKELGILYTDNDGVLEIPLRNAVNYAIEQGETSVLLYAQLREVSGSSYVDTIAIRLYLYEGISYYDMLAPLNKQCEGYTAAYSHSVVTPPSVMLNPAIMGGTLTAKGIIAESNIQSRDKSAVWAYSASGVGTTITPTGDRLNQLEIPYTADTLTLTSTDYSYSRKWKLTKADYCTDLVCVRWTSQTGAVRQHYFPVVGFLQAEGDALSIISAGNGYDVRKNFYKGVRCRLTGLTAYDTWYYQDLLLASDAHAVLIPTASVWSTEIASMETAVYAEGGKAETPQGGGFNNFEFTLKLRHYDTF